MITMVLGVFAAVAVYCLLVFVRPHRTCRGCGGERVVRSKGRTRKCARRQPGDYFFGSHSQPWLFSHQYLRWMSYLSSP